MEKNCIIFLMALACILVLASPAMAYANVTGERTINTSTIQAGNTFQVSVNMSIAGDEPLSGPAIDEDLPSGWTATEVDNAGLTYQEVNTIWLYSSGSLNPGATKTVIYDVTIPSNATAGTYSITGAVSGNEPNGTNPIYRCNSITGDTDIEVEAPTEVHIYEGDDYKTKIVSAAEGTTIYWHNGTYSEPVTLPDNVHVIGDGRVSLTSHTSAINGGNNAVIEGVSISNLYNPEAINLTLYNCHLGSITVTDSAIIENCTFPGYGNLQVGINPSQGTTSTGGGGAIRNNIFKNFDGERGCLIKHSNNISIVNNTFKDSPSMDYAAVNIYVCCDIEVNGNLFRDIVTSGDIIYVDSSNNVSIHGNTIENCTGDYDILYFNDNDVVFRENIIINSSGGDAIVEVADGEATLYLNNFINCLPPYSYQYGSGSISWTSPTAIDYTYAGKSYNSILGNYYDTYTGEDTNGDGIGDTPFALAVGTDNYPLIDAWDNDKITSELSILYNDTVDLMETDFNFTASSSGIVYNASQRTVLGALAGTGLDYELNDSDYVTNNSFFIDSIAGIADRPGAGWEIYVNDNITPSGIGLNAVKDGDIISFYYAPYNSTTSAQMLDAAIYLVEISVNDKTPVEAERNIVCQTFNVGDDVNQVTSTLVTVHLVAVADIDSLILQETIPAGWILTPAENNNSSFRADPDVSDTYEWAWTECMSSGNSTTISYLLQIPDGKPITEYEVSGVVSAYVSDIDVNDINVLGDCSIEIEEDWSSWDDVDSDGGAAITTSELQKAISCWLNNAPAPVTGSKVTTDRLQLTIHQWLTT